MSRFTQWYKRQMLFYSQRLALRNLVLGCEACGKHRNPTHGHSFREVAENFNKTNKPNPNVRKLSEAELEKYRHAMRPDCPNCGNANNVEHTGVVLQYACRACGTAITLFNLEGGTN